ncbi:MAG: hypothetical protein LBK52_04210 [Deltaproteobacteria bacterium]|nr:hypothetical protein [Deltaproteobacteria bacterium]
MKLNTNILYRITLGSLALALLTQLLILFSLSLGGDQGQSFQAAHSAASLAEKMTRLGPEKTAAFLEFSDPGFAWMWLEKPQGEVFLGRADNSLTWDRRLLLGRQTVLGEISLWETGEVSLFQAPVRWEGQTYYLLSARQKTWSFGRGDLLFHGFFCLFAVNILAGALLWKQAAKPGKDLLRDIQPLCQGLDRRVNVPAGQWGPLAGGINKLAGDLSRLRENRDLLDGCLAESRRQLGAMHLSSGRLEESLSQNHLAGVRAAMNDLARQQQDLDFFLQEVILIEKLAVSPENYKLEPVDLSALAFEISCRYQELARQQGCLLNSQVNSDLSVRSHYDLTGRLLEKLLDQALASGSREISLSLQREGPAVVLGVEYQENGVSAKVLEQLFRPRIGRLEYQAPAAAGSPGPLPAAMGLTLVREAAGLFRARASAQALVRENRDFIRLTVRWPDVGHFPYHRTG